MATENTSSKAATADRLIFHPKIGPAGDVLVAILLRGGMDGIYTIPPFGDRALREQRKAFGFVRPKQNGVIDLDGFFGLHPDFSPLEPLYRANQLAIVNAVGLSEPLLSHFDATRAIEQGTWGQRTETGWLGRHLAAKSAGGLGDSASIPSSLRAVAMGHGIPRVLLGADAQSLDSLGDFRLEVPAGWDPGFSRVLRQLYRPGHDLASVAGRNSLSTIAVLQRLAKSEYQPENSAVYSPDRFGQHLSQAAQLIKADVGLEAAVLTLSDWDSHVSQSELLAGPMQSLAQSLQGFAKDLGDHLQRVVVVVMSEFGRRIAPNDAGGTDHGRATAMMVLGGGIRGGKVYGNWPGLATDELDDQGNLRVTTDYRNVLAEIVDRRLKNPRLESVFPGLQPKYLDFTA